MLIREVKNSIELEFNQNIARETLMITKVILDGGGTLRSSIIITDDISMISGGNSISVQKIIANAKVQLDYQFGIMSILESIPNGIRKNGTQQDFDDAYIEIEDDRINIYLASNNIPIPLMFSNSITYYIEYEALSLTYKGQKKKGTVSIWTV
jgi:hypothetical protein